MDASYTNQTMLSFDEDGYAQIYQRTCKGLGVRTLDAKFNYVYGYGTQNEADYEISYATKSEDIGIEDEETGVYEF